MTATLRRARPEDAPELARLRYAFRNTLAEAGAREDEGAFLVRAERWLAQRLAGPQWLAWVALDTPGGIVGQCFLQSVEKIPNPVAEPEWIGYITNVYVKPAWRGRGIASLLLDMALAHCREHGAYSVVLWPTDESRRLYQRNGFNTPDKLMELSCSTTTPSIPKISSARRRS